MIYTIRYILFQLPWLGRMPLNVSDTQSAAAKSGRGAAAVQNLSEVDVRRVARSVLDCGCPDTTSRVIQHSARTTLSGTPQPNVNNSAAPKMKSGEKVLRSRHAWPGRIAPGGSRSDCPHPTRIRQSLPARPAASVPTSERTKAYEAPGIRSTHDGATMHKRKTKPMNNWK